MHRVFISFLALTALALAGCRSIGPRVVPRDRFEYSRGIAESWKDQTLLNIVKFRYLDLPVFLDVASVVSGYSLETSVNAGGQVSSSDAIQGNTLSMGAGGRFTDRPTITYLPLTGDKFLAGFLTPISPAKIFQLIQAGYAADFILELSADSFNGLKNRARGVMSKRQADPEFFRALALLREIQDSGSVGTRVEPGEDKQPSTVFFLRSEHVEPELQAKADELRRLLGAPPGQQKFRLVNSPVRGAPDELTVGTRSLIQVMGALALGVDVPPAHAQRRLTPPGEDPSVGEAPLLRVRSGNSRPDDAFVAVPYQGAWFWIANDDWKSKRTLTSIMFLFTLADTGGSDRLPTITIPAQ
jgi:hypothetical protein